VWVFYPKDLAHVHGKVFETILSNVI